MLQWTSQDVGAGAEGKGATLPNDDKAGNFGPDRSNVFQILITDDGNMNLSEEIRLNVDSVKYWHRDSKHHLLDAESVRQFIAGNFSADVLEAFDGFRPYAYKADLAKCCLLFVHGGLYVDLGCRFIRRFEVPKHKSIGFFRDQGIGSGAPWSVSNAIIYAKPRREELRLTIEFIVSNFKNRLYGTNSIAITGPIVFGQAIAQVNKPEDCFAGELRPLTPEFEDRNYCFVTPEGRLLAVRTKANIAGLAHMGIKGTNDYCHLWRRRQVYHESKPTYALNFSDHSWFRGESRPEGVWIEQKGDENTYHVWGPYLDLPAGDYAGVISFAPGTVSGSCTIDVCANVGTQVLASAPVSEQQAKASEEITIGFSLSAPASKVEVRLSSCRKFSGLYTGTSIVQAAGAGRAAERRSARTAVARVASRVLD